MAREELRNKRPFKIWDSWRNVRKGLVASNFEELVHRGKEKLGIPLNESVSFVLESDGTAVEDGEYFKTLTNNTILLLLRHGERWCPTGVDIIRAAISAIPRIVCETICALELHDETPSWKIMDNKGRVTVVLHWDQRSTSGTIQSVSSGAGKLSDLPVGAKYSPTKKPDIIGGIGSRHSLVVQSSLDKRIPNPQGIGYPGPQITVINHDEPLHLQRSFSSASNSSCFGPPPALGPLSQARGRLVRQGTSSSFDSTSIHVHTPECAGHVHQPQLRNGSPIDGPDAAGGTGSLECDFHCCALHEEGRRIAVHKSVATSPIQDPLLIQSCLPPERILIHQASTPSPQPPSSLSDGTRRPGIPKGHVRFRDTAPEEEPSHSARQAQAPPLLMHQHSQQQESSESETENTVMEDEVVTSEKFLLLIDHLTEDQKHHLTIKDIGIILERLSSKILDVERLDRESENEECYNWTIKAIIRGDMLRELGVIYNNNFYAISEHPGYKEGSDENNEEAEEEEEEEEEDRL